MLEISVNTPRLQFRDFTRKTPRRSIGDRSVEIFTPPTPCWNIGGFPICLHALHVWMSDTTCTMLSDYSDHVCHLHSMEAYGESLLPEPGYNSFPYPSSSFSSINSAVLYADSKLFIILDNFGINIVEPLCLGHIFFGGIKDLISLVAVLFVVHDGSIRTKIS